MTGVWSGTRGEGVATVILAGGASRRMGSPKQLLPYLGRPILQHVLDLAAGAAAGELLVVLGHAARRIESAIDVPGRAKIVVNRDYAAGQASSLTAGLAACDPSARAALILLADQPELPEEAITRVLDAYRRTGGPVVRAAYQGTSGHPVLLDRSIWPALSGGAADRGAGPALARRPEWVVSVNLDLPAPLEVDTPADYRALMARARNRTGGGRRAEAV